MPIESEAEVIICPEWGHEFGERSDCIACSAAREADRLVDEMGVL